MSHARQFCGPVIFFGAKLDILGTPQILPHSAVARRADHLRVSAAPKIVAIAAILSPLKRRRAPACTIGFLWTAGPMHRLALCVLLAPTVTALHRGDAAPAFVGENYDGQQVTLASATGPKGLVLWFYPKAGTGG